MLFFVEHLAEMAGGLPLQQQPRVRIRGKKEKGLALPSVEGGMLEQHT